MSEVEQRRRLAARVAGLGLLGFINMLVYSAVRSPVEALFVTAHGEQALPWVWLVVTVAVVATVALYDRWCARANLLRLFGAASLVSAAGFVLLLLGRRAELPLVHYALYALKDIYVVVLIETFYSLANASFPMGRARWIYGAFGLLSTLGSMAGNAATRVVAAARGSVAAIWAAVPVLGLLGLVCFPLARLAPPARVPSRPTDQSLAGALRVVLRSSYLLQLLVVVALIQVVVTLVDYDYYRAARQSYHGAAEITVVTSTVYGAIDVATIVLNLATGAILRLLGVPVTLAVVPLFIAGGLLLRQINPTFLVMAGVKVASKCFDYSIYRAAKELLYIPLDYEEKTKGKSVVDIITYRVGKGGASLLVLALQGLALARLVPQLTLGLVVAWIAVTILIARRFRRAVPREQEMSGSRGG